MNEWSLYVVPVHRTSTVVLEARVHEQINLLEWRSPEGSPYGEWQGGAMRTREPVVRQLSGVLESVMEQRGEPQL